MGVASVWTGSSRNGFGILLNNTANKISAHGYAGFSPEKIVLVSATSVNDGNWHHLAYNWNTDNAGANALYIDGVSEASGNSSAAWPIANTGVPFTIGDNNDTFWASFVGDIAEMATFGRNLVADEIASLQKGFSPAMLPGFNLHIPFVRDFNNRRDAFATLTGTTYVDHPRRVGGNV